MRNATHTHTHVPSRRRRRTLHVDEGVWYLTLCELLLRREMTHLKQITALSHLNPPTSIASRHESLAILLSRCSSRSSSPTPIIDCEQVLLVFDPKFRGTGPLAEKSLLSLPPPSSSRRRLALEAFYSLRDADQSAFRPDMRRTGPYIAIDPLQAPSLDSGIPSLFISWNEAQVHNPRSAFLAEIAPFGPS